MPDAANSAPPPTYDVIAIGNAIVDVMAPCDDAKITELGMARGGMSLVDADGAKRLYDAMGPAREISGGSAANTLAGLANLGAKCAFIGQVADDQLGEVFSHDIRAAGIAFDTPVRDAEPPTARCLIFVTPDGERTMNTFLGASQFLPPAALSEDMIRDAAILYLEGYLWDPEEPRRAMRRAIAVAREAGRKVAFTASESFVIERHGDDFRALIAEGLIDILFVNETELATLTGKDDFDAGLERIVRRKCRCWSPRAGPMGRWPSPLANAAPSRRNRWTRSSIRPGRAICSRRGSCRARCGAKASKIA